MACAYQRAEGDPFVTSVACSCFMFIEMCFLMLLLMRVRLCVAVISMFCFVAASFAAVSVLSLPWIPNLT